VATNEDIMRELGRLSAKFDTLNEVVVGQGGDGGLRGDVRALMSLRDKGLGVVFAIGLFGAILVLGVKAWITDMLT